jgi:hypothetical protein
VTGEFETGGEHAHAAFGEVGLSTAASTSFSKSADLLTAATTPIDRLYMSLGVVASAALPVVALAVAHREGRFVGRCRSAIAV